MLATLNIDAEKLASLGLATERSRGAVHMATEDFTSLCNRLVKHIEGVRDRFLARQ